jgi:hypothetical protein
MHLTAAQGWLELGNHEEAFEELEKIDRTLTRPPRCIGGALGYLCLNREMGLLSGDR